MSLLLCTSCGRPVDADDDPECFVNVDHRKDEPYCERCRIDLEKHAEPCTFVAKHFGCSCYVPAASSYDIDPPQPRVDEWCPLHGRDPDYEYEKRRDDELERHF